MHRTHANVNFMYTLTDEDGEVHPPKDSERAEISISSELMTSIRQNVLTDALAIANKHPRLLSSKWYSQLGIEMPALPTPPAAPSRSAERR